MSTTMETTFVRRARRRSALLNFIQQLVQGVCLARRRRTTDRALRTLSERDLKDIGLSRTATGYDVVTWDTRSRKPHLRPGR